MSKQTNIPTVEETNRKLSEPVRPVGYEQPQVAPTVESDGKQVEETSETVTCDQCEFEAKSVSGLKSHQRKHKPATDPVEETPEKPQVEEEVSK